LWRAYARFRGRYHPRSPSFSQPQSEFDRPGRVGAGGRVAHENSYIGTKIPFVRVSQRIGERRNLFGGWLVGGYQAIAEARNRSQKWCGNWIFNSERRRAEVFR